MSRAQKRSRLAEQLARQVAGGRELVVLADGPWGQRWYWADELAAMQETVRRFPADHPAGELQNYRRTSCRFPHPEDSELFGQAYRYLPAPAATTRDYDLAAGVSR